MQPAVQQSPQHFLPPNRTDSLQPAKPQFDLDSKTGAQLVRGVRHPHQRGRDTQTHRHTDPVVGLLSFLERKLTRTNEHMQSAGHSGERGARMEPNAQLRFEL
jgi:hypothetical protein